jgi:cysteinyl-tRNA synthetase
MLERFYQALVGVELNATAQHPLVDEIEQAFFAAMDDDFNTPKAISVLFELVNELNKCKQTSPQQASVLATKLVELAGIIGLLQQDPDAFLKGDAKEGELTAEVIEEMIAERVEAKAAKDFAQADLIRERLAEQGVILKDSREGTTWYREG